MGEVKYTASGGRWERTGLSRPTKPRQGQGETDEAFASRVSLWREQDRAYMRAYDKRRRGVDQDYANSRRKCSRDWKARNKGRVKDYRSAYWQNNKEAEKDNQARWYKANPGGKKRHDATYRLKHADEIASYRNSQEFRLTRNRRERARYHGDNAYRTEKILRTSLAQAVRLYSDSKKRDRFVALIGCTIKELVAHLERQFWPGMTWGNQGDWEIDHIRPCASFDMNDPAQQLECFRFSNLQPLWKQDNRNKRDRLDWTPPLKEAA